MWSLHFWEMAQLSIAKEATKDTIALRSSPKIRTLSDLRKSN